MSSQWLHFLLAISWILRLKKDLFVFLTVFQKVFQSSIFFEDLYFAKSLLQLSFHQLFTCLVILTIFEFLVHALSTMLAKSLTTLSNLGISEMLDMFNFVNDAITSLMNNSSSSLFFVIVLLQRLIFSLEIGIVIDKGTWSEVRHHSRWIKWLFNLEESHQRNIQSMTKFESLLLLEYLVRTWLIGHERFKLKESAMIMKWRIPDTVANIEISSHN